MNEEKIIEIAERYGQLENIDHGLAWVLSEDALLDFAQSVIEESRDTSTIEVPISVWDKLKDVNTVTDLIKALKVAEKAE